VAADDIVADVLTSSLLDRMVGSAAEAARDPLQGFLRQIVAPHVVPGEDPRRDALLADVDAAVADGMRAVLHHPRFQALESLWRGVDFLVRRLETGVALKLYLIDATTDELRADLTGSGDPESSGLARVLRRTAQGGGWSSLVLDHAFGPTEDDLVLLYALAALATRLGAAVLGSALPNLVALDSFAELMPEADNVHEWQHEAWHAFRRRTEAASAGLVLPRFLLRVPYGEAGEPCDILRFEEMTTPPRHDDFLWGNGAFAAALLLGLAFDQSGWEMRPGQQMDLTGLPLHTWRSSSGPEIQPCAECLMTDRLAGALMDAGPMVLATIKHGDTARLVRFHSLAAPLRALQGPWSRV
jgi:type VI secretion system protein ImpC